MTAVPSTAEAAEIVGRTTGGTVIDIVRQPRWRPTWFLEVERDGIRLPLVLRGDRPDSRALPLRHEYTFHRLMAERDFPVPGLHAYIETPGCIDAVLMDRVPGRPDFEGVDDGDRDRVVDEYLQELARLHQCDPVPFLEAGVVCPAPDERGVERRYRKHKTHPDPFAEFCLGWLRRTSRTTAAAGHRACGIRASSTTMAATSSPSSISSSVGSAIRSAT